MNYQNIFVPDLSTAIIQSIKKAPAKMQAV
jgi:hypothetical protein